MIRGALILTAGFALGYAKGLQENVAVLEKLDEMATRFAAFLDEQDRKAKAEQAEADEAPSATETPEVVTPDDVENPREGETS